MSCSPSAVPMVQKPLVGQHLLIIEASWSHSNTPHTEHSSWLHTAPTRDRHHTSDGIQTCNPSKQVDVDPCLEVWLHWSQNQHNTANKICLGINHQICVATFNLKCLSRLLPTKGLLVLSVLIVGDVNGTWCMRLMTGMNFLWYLKYMNKRRWWMHQLW